MTYVYALDSLDMRLIVTVPVSVLVSVSVSLPVPVPVPVTKKVDMTYDHDM